MENIPNTLQVSTMLPLDGKLYFKSIQELKDLGLNGQKAFIYYDKMLAFCTEDGKEYLWDQETNYNFEGLLYEGFTYPNGIIIGDIDYSNKTYNFFEYQGGQVEHFKRIIVDGEFSAVELPGDSGYKFSIINSQEENLSWQIDSDIFDYGDYQWEKNVDPLSIGVQQRIDVVYFSNSGTIEYAKGSEAESSYPYIPLTSILKTFVIITQDGIYFQDGSFIPKLSEAWIGGYVSPETSHPDTILIGTHFRNYLINPLSRDIVIRAFADMGSSLTTWNGSRVKVGRDINGNPVRINHMDSYGTVIQTPFFFPNGKNYDLRPGEILEFDRIKEFPQLPDAPNNQYRLYFIGSNMLPEEAITGFNTAQFIYNGVDSTFQLPPEAKSIVIATINKGITYDFTFDTITKIAEVTDPEMYSGDLIQFRYSI